MRGGCPESRRSEDLPATLDSGPGPTLKRAITVPSECFLPDFAFRDTSLLWPSSSEHQLCGAHLCHTHSRDFDAAKPEHQKTRAFVQCCQEAMAIPKNRDELALPSVEPLGQNELNRSITEIFNPQLLAQGIA